MKNIIIITCLLIVHSTFAQNQIKLSKSNFGIDYAIPDLPAFKAIGFEPSDILRPSSSKEFSVLLPQFYNNKKVNLPNSFAVELAPFQIFNSKKIITLDEYLKNKIINSLRISVGINADSTEKEPKARKLGVGLRISIIDKGNFEQNRSFLKEEGEILRKSLLKDVEIEDSFKVANQIRLADNIPENLNKEFIKYKEGKYKDFYPEELEKLKKMYREKYWNAEKLDVAFALSSRSKDELIKNLKYNKFSTWVTYAYPINRWGQLLIGYTGAYNNNLYMSDIKKEISYWQNSINLRAYGGTNKLKGYLEGQFKTKELDISNSTQVILGGEYNIIESYGVWLNFYIGIRKNTNVSDSQFVSNFDLKFALPEKK